MSVFFRRLGCAVALLGHAIHAAAAIRNGRVPRASTLDALGIPHGALQPSVRRS